MGFVVGTPNAYRSPPHLAYVSAPGAASPFNGGASKGQGIAVFPTMRKKKRPAEAGRLVINR